MIAHCMDQIVNIDPDAFQGLLKRYQRNSWVEMEELQLPVCTC